MQHRAVIVGGGVYGCAVAWNLARSGTEVLLLEAAEVASGASGGFGKRGVRANRRDPRELPLMRRAYELWPQLEAQLGAPTGYQRTGGLNLIEQETTGTKGGLVAAHAHAWTQRRLGIPTEVLDARQLRELEPELPTTVRGALHCPHDGVADHTATTRAFAAAARRHGATIREHTRVVGLRRDGDRVTGVRTEDGETVDVDGTLLLLNNDGAAELVERELGTTLPLWRILPQALALQPTKPVRVSRLVGHDHRPLSIKTIPDGRIMLSGGWRGRWNAELGRGETVDAHVAGNIATAAEVYAGLRDAEVEIAEASRPESCAVDEIPIVDAVPGTANVLLGAGWTGHGFAIAPAVAELLAHWATSGERPGELAPFSYARFA